MARANRESIVRENCLVQGHHKMSRPGPDVKLLNLSVGRKTMIIKE